MKMFVPSRAAGVLRAFGRYDSPAPAESASPELCRPLPELFFPKTEPGRNTIFAPSAGPRRWSIFDPPKPETKRKPPVKIDPVLNAQIVSKTLAAVAHATGDKLADVMHAYELALTLPARYRCEISSVTGFLCEALGREKLEQRYSECYMDSGLEIFHKLNGQTAGELDGIAIRDRDGDVVALAESKANRHMVSSGLRRLRMHLVNIQNGTYEGYRVRGEDQEQRSFDQNGPFSRHRFAKMSEQDCYGITTRDAQDRENLIKIDISYDSLASIAELVVRRVKAQRQQRKLMTL